MGFITDHNKIKDDQLRRFVRLTVLLDATECVGLNPLPLRRLHAFAYIVNALSKIWGLPALDGKILKRRGGPFYPTLQRDIDFMVGTGMIVPSSVRYSLDEKEEWALECSYSLNYDLCDNLLQVIKEFNDEKRSQEFIKEVAIALSALDHSAIDDALEEDANYSNPITGFNNVIDFEEWQDVNYSSYAANIFSNFTPERRLTSPGKKVHLYVRHLYRRYNYAQQG